MSNVVAEGERLIEAWMSATQRHEDAKRNINALSCAVTNSSNALGKWLMPHDKKVGEKFSVWYGDSLIEVTVTNGDPELRIRMRGKSL